MKGKRAKINDILIRFDFRICKDFMVSNNITWEAEGVEYIPTLAEIELKARKMLEAATETSVGFYKASLGGLTVRKTSVSLELSYVLESKSA